MGSSEIGRHPNMLKTALNFALHLPQYVPTNDRFDIQVLVNVHILLKHFTLKSRYSENTGIDKFLLSLFIKISLLHDRLGHSFNLC